MQVTDTETSPVTFEDFKNQVLSDYRLGRVSREISLLGRREVLTGKAKFGIFGDGKELPQLAMARVFRNGDFRSGYYRDQTFAMAIGNLTPENFFATLYADANIERDPSSGGRQMNCHFASRSLNEDGSWKDLTQMKNVSPDVSPTSGQMPRLVGLAMASKYYKAHPFPGSEKFSKNGNEIAFGTIGDASTAEGLFWETLNVTCALELPMIISIWNDDYGISVPSAGQRAKKDFSEMLSGFQRKEGETTGCEIIRVKGWDYVALQEAYQRAEYYTRVEGIPVVMDVEEVTQPQGHSTSGSHERYKSPERLAWEKEYDGLKQFRDWILNYSMEIDGRTVRLATSDELDQIDAEAKQRAKDAKKNAWEDFQNVIRDIENRSTPLIQDLQNVSPNSDQLKAEVDHFNSIVASKTKKDVYRLIRRCLWWTRGENSSERVVLENFLNQEYKTEHDNYSSHLYSESQWAAVNVPEVLPAYDDHAEMVDGRIVVRDNFDKLFEKYPELLVFGEDCGNIGDVNQGLEGLQKKYGADRVSDTGIREATILGQGVGLALRGLRPIAEIQYLDYLLFALQGMSDDLATVQYRTKGGQKAPVIVRTRGHRLEGIWHSGSYLAGILNLVKGICVLVPRNLTKAAGFYNTMMRSDDASLIIETLNGYRLKEMLPTNLGEFTVPVGKVEVTRQGSDVTVVTYGSIWRMVMEAAEELAQFGINVEVIDAQSLMPFDLSHDVTKSLTKTNRLVLVDEDVPGGATAYMLQKIMEEQHAFSHLDSEPITVTAKAHRPAYGSDGDYFSKPSVEDIFEKIYNLMHETNPKKFPKI